jgi:hypothetical protein
MMEKAESKNRPPVRPPDIEARVEANLNEFPLLNKFLREPLLKSVRQPGSSLQTRILRHLYTYDNKLAGKTNNIAERLEKFLQQGQRAGIDFSTPLASLSTDLDWHFRSVISELRAGLAAKKQYPQSKVIYLAPSKAPTPDFRIDSGYHDEYAEVKNVESSRFFDVFVDGVEAECVRDPRFKATYLVGERYFFEEPFETPRKLAKRMQNEVGKIFNWIEPQLGSLPVELTCSDLGLAFVEKVIIQPSPEYLIAGLPNTPPAATEVNARCCDRLSRGILSRLINQTTRAYWKLREYRKVHTDLDHIYLDVDFGCIPFDDVIREKVHTIFKTWGISSLVHIHILE